MFISNQILDFGRYFTITFGNGFYQSSGECLSLTSKHLLVQSQQLKQWNKLWNMFRVTVKTSGWLHWRHSGVFIVNFEHSVFIVNFEHISRLLTFHISFNCFYSRLWTDKFLLGRWLKLLKVKERNRTICRSVKIRNEYKTSLWCYCWFFIIKKIIY